MLLVLGEWVKGQRVGVVLVLGESRDKGRCCAGAGCIKGQGVLHGCWVSGDGEEGVRAQEVTNVLDPARVQAGAE